MVQHLVQLFRDQVVDLCDSVGNGLLGVAAQRHLSFEDLANELLLHVLAALLLARFPSEPPLRDDGVQQRHLFGLHFRGLGRVLLRRAAHFLSPSTALPSSASSLARSSVFESTFTRMSSSLSLPRSEERRVGKECRSRWS